MKESTTASAARGGAAQPDQYVDARAGRLTRLGRALLRVPLFYKILIANAGLLLVLVVTTAAVLERLSPVHSVETMPVLVVGLAGLLVSILLNAVILRLALWPLHELEEVAASVGAGEIDGRRAPVSPLADRELTRLITTFNGALDAVESYRARLRDVAARALEAGEAERKRIARELHDDTAQGLASVLLRLRVARSSTDPAARDAALDESREALSEAIERVRSFALVLRPPALDMLGLVAALRSHARLVSEGSPLSVEVVAGDDLDTDLGEHAELALYRMVQEALSNVLRHADATQAVVTLARSGAGIRVTIEDDGAGFDVDEVLADPTRGLGLFGMQERASYVSGSVAVESAPGAGTKIIIEVPVWNRGAHG